MSRKQWRHATVLACRYAAAKLGYSSIKSKQMDVLTAFLAGKDVFAILPTGYGKSFCFACLPLVYNRLLGKECSIVVVLSPLTAIIKDQVKYGYHKYKNLYIIYMYYM
jgi:superfamily II DNA helicase RecQ